MTVSSLSAARDLAAHGAAYALQITQAAQAHDLDPRLLAAVAAQETGGPGGNAGRNIVGDGGHGRGIFQIDDRWHSFANSRAAMDPAANADYAAGMLSDLIRRCGGNVHDALSAYNAGSPHATGTVTTWQDGARLGYADSVMRHYQDLSGTAAAAPASGNARLPLPNTLSAPPPLPDPAQHDYRQIAGLDRNGNQKNGVDYASLVFSDDQEDTWASI